MLGPAPGTAQEVAAADLIAATISPLNLIPASEADQAADVMEPPAAAAADLHVSAPEAEQAVEVREPLAAAEATLEIPSLETTQAGNVMEPQVAAAATVDIPVSDAALPRTRRAAPKRSLREDFVSDLDDLSECEDSRTAASSRSWRPGDADPEDSDGHTSKRLRPDKVVHPSPQLHAHRLQSPGLQVDTTTLSPNEWRAAH